MWRQRDRERARTSKSQICARERDKYEKGASKRKRRRKYGHQELIQQQLRNYFMPIVSLLFSAAFFFVVFLFCGIQINSMLLSV